MHFNVLKLVCQFWNTCPLCTCLIQSIQCSMHITHLNLTMIIFIWYYYNCFSINRSRLNLGIVSQDIYSHTHITELHKTCLSFLISIPPREFEDMKMWDTHSITILKSFSISFIYVVFLCEDKCVDEIPVCCFAQTNIS